jgi:hypothetical protein
MKVGIGGLARAEKGSIFRVTNKLNSCLQQYLQGWWGCLGKVHGFLIAKQRNAKYRVEVESGVNWVAGGPPERPC